MTSMTCTSAIKIEDRKSEKKRCEERQKIEDRVRS